MLSISHDVQYEPDASHGPLNDITSKRFSELSGSKLDEEMNKEDDAYRVRPE